jgi:uncharacterized surface protein with fasciclin (FAS1) repeats
MPVITDEYKARSIGPGRIAFDCDEEKGPVVEGRKVAGDYMLGENGVVYMLDDVLIPDRCKAQRFWNKAKTLCTCFRFVSARTILELAEARHLTIFIQLARTAGLEEMLNGLGEFTFFAPSEAAWYCKCLK